MKPCTILCCAARRAVRVGHCPAARPPAPAATSPNLGPAPARAPATVRVLQARPALPALPDRPRAPAISHKGRRHSPRDRLKRNMRLGLGGVLLLGLRRDGSGASRLPRQQAPRGPRRVSKRTGTWRHTAGNERARLAPGPGAGQSRREILDREGRRRTTYQAQWQSSKDQARAIADGAKALSQNPERLSAGARAVFPDRRAGNHAGNPRRGDSRSIRLRPWRRSWPAWRRKTASIVAASSATSSNLAAQREQEYNVMDREAQRCRGMVFSAQPPKTSGKKK